MVISLFAEQGQVIMLEDVISLKVGGGGEGYLKWKVTGRKGEGKKKKVEGGHAM
jgi:hypothetical protein